MRLGLGLSLLTASLFLPKESEAALDYGRCVGASAQIETLRQRRALETVASRILEDHPAMGKVDAVLCEDAAQALEDIGIEIEIQVPDLAQQIEDERLRAQQSQSPRQAAPSQGKSSYIEDLAWYDDFKDLPAIEARLQGLAASFPKMVELRSIGQSLENRPLWMIRIRAAEPTVKPRPGFLYTGGMHAREWISPMTVMYTIEALISGYGVDPEITRLLDQVDVYVVPVVNPDGFVYTWAPDGDRFWRKNRRDNQDGSFGVDLNRNWDQGFDINVGSSTDPASIVYRGKGPFSEPEIAALRDLVGSLPDLAGYMDLHSYSQMVLWGPGYYYAPAGRLREEECVAREVAEAVSAVHGAFYKELPIPSLYPTTGASADWTRNKAGLKSLALEVRPEASQANGTFVTSPGQILPTGEEHMVTVKMMMRWILEELPSEAGCDEDQFDCVKRCHVEAACSEKTKELNMKPRGSINTVDYDYHGASFRFCVDRCEMKTGQLARGACKDAGLALNRCIGRAHCGKVDSECKAAREEFNRRCKRPQGPCGWMEYGTYRCGGDGADPSGKWPMMCPSNIEENKACSLGWVGCCDAEGNAWSCRDGGQGRYIHKKTVCMPSDSGAQGSSTSGDGADSTGSGSTTSEQATASEASTSQSSSEASDSTATTPSSTSSAADTSSPAPSTGSEPAVEAGEPDSELPPAKKMGCAISSHRQPYYFLAFALALLGLRRRGHSKGKAPSSNPQ